MPKKKNINLKKGQQKLKLIVNRAKEIRIETPKLKWPSAEAPIN